MSKGQKDLRSAQCPGGISQVQLDKCVAEIKGERCSNPTDTVARVASCQTTALCVR